MNRLPTKLLFAGSALALLVVLSLVGAGCGPDIESDPPPEGGIEAVFDAEAGTVPLPNDAALDDQGTLPRLPGAGEESSNGVFLDWLDSLHGWLPSQSITIPFDGPLDPESVTEDRVRMYEVREGGELRELNLASVSVTETPVTVTRDGEAVEVEGAEIAVEPAESLRVRTEYAVAVSNEIRGRPKPGAELEPVSKPAAVFFAASKQPLVDENGEKTLDVLPDDATAQSLEALRTALAPVFEGLGERGWAREDVAVAFSWTTVRDPRSIFDSETGTVPLPNVLALDSETNPEKRLEKGTVPRAGFSRLEEDSAQGELERHLNGLHNWPTSTPIRLPVDADVDELTLGPNTVQLWRLPEEGAPERVELSERRLVQECTGLAACTAGCSEGDPDCRQACRASATSDARNQYAALASCAESNGCEASSLGGSCLTSNCGGQQAACRERSERADLGGFIELVPEEPLGRRTRFAAFVTSDVRGPDRTRLKAPAAVRLALQPHPVFEGGESKVDSLSDAQAERIQKQLRPALQPLAATVESATDVSRSDIVGVWSWTTLTDTVVEFDPGEGVLPIPNEFVRQGTDGTVSLPTEGATGLQKSLLETLNRRQGFSTTAAGWIPVDGKIDEGSLSADSVSMLWIPGSEKYGSDAYAVDYREEWDRLVFEPEVPFERDDAYVDKPDTLAFNTGVVSTELKGANGEPVQPSVSFVFLRSPYPLIENGEIQVQQLRERVESGDLEMSDVQLLESARQTFEQLLPLASGVAGIDDRSEVASAFAFHPENTAQPAQDARARAVAAFEARDSADRRAERSSGQSWSTVTQPGSSYRGPGGNWPAVDLSAVGRIQWTASFDTVRMLKPSGQSDGRLRDQSELTDEPVGISVFLPEQPPPGQGGGRAYCRDPVPVVLAQHGLGGSRIGPGLALANALAERGVAVVTMDFTGHGGRTDGVSSLHPAQTPMQSGAHFLTADIVRSKNRVLQSIVDVSLLADIARSGALETAVDGDPATDCFREGADATVGYAGHSLGGFIGVPATAVEPDVDVGVFNAAGGTYREVLTTGNLGASLENALDDAGLKKGSFGRFRALNFVQWIAGPIDPLAFAPFLRETVLERRTFEPGSGFTTEGGMGANDVLVQMVEDPGSGDDPVVPNATTESLAEAAGPEIPLDEATFPGGHGLLVDLDPGAQTESARCARRQLAAWLESGLTGDAAVPEALEAGNCLGGSP